MTTIIQNSAVRLISEGILVSRATAALPATAAQNIFTVSGGRILLVALVGEVTTIIQAQATTVKVTSTPTTGSAIDLSTATADINALERRSGALAFGWRESTRWAFTEAIAAGYLVTDFDHQNRGEQRVGTYHLSRGKKAGDFG